MARLAITPTTWIKNSLQAFTFTTLASSQEGWYVNLSDYTDSALICWSTHTSAVPITICAGTSESTEVGYTKWIFRDKGDISTSVSSSGISLVLLESMRFKSSGGLYIDCASSGSTSLHWAAIELKPKL